MEEDQEKNEVASEVNSPKSTNNMLYVAGAVVVLIVVIGIAFAMKGSTNSANSEPNEGTTSEEMSDSSMNNSDSMVEGASTSANLSLDPTAHQIQVEAGSYYYKPNTMTVKVGEKVQIVMHSVSMAHNFNIDELNVHGPMIKNGDTQIIEFTPEKTGTFEYYCSVANHRAKGQVGKITVTK